MNVVMGYQGFNKVLSRWQKLWGRKKLTPVSRAVQVHALPEKFWNLDLLEYISSILEQKLEFLNRTQTSLNFGFFIQRQHMNNIANSFKPLAVSLSVLQNVNHIICKNWSNFQRKVAGKFWWNSLQMSLAADSYWKLWVKGNRNRGKSQVCYSLYWEFWSEVQLLCSFPLKSKLFYGKVFYPTVVPKPLFKWKLLMLKLMLQFVLNRVGQMHVREWLQQWRQLWKLKDIIAMGKRSQVHRLVCDLHWCYY